MNIGTIMIVISIVNMLVAPLIFVVILAMAKENKKRAIFLLAFMEMGGVALLIEGKYLNGTLGSLSAFFLMLAVAISFCIIIRILNDAEIKSTKIGNSTT